MKKFLPRLISVFAFLVFPTGFLLGQGDPACTGFSFEAPYHADVAGVQSDLEIVDINRDGIPDVVTVIPDFDQVSVLLGRHDGTLGSPAVFSVGDFPQGVAVADFDRDGELDLAVTVVVSDSVTILKGDGTGNFSLVGSFSVTGDPGKIATADLNNDGWPDVIVNTDQALQLYLGSLSGFSRSAYIESALPDFTSIRLADIDEDGKVDIALSFASSVTDGGVAIFKGNGLGGASFTSAFFSSTRIQGLLVEDFTNDGNLDIVATGFAPASGGGSGKLLLLIGQGNGGFNAPPQIEGYTNGGEMDSGDFNRDGKLDFVTSSGSIYLGDNLGGFVFSDGPYPITLPIDIAAVDFDGDGYLDVIQANDWRSRIYITRGDGNGRLRAPEYAPVVQVPDSTAADFNGDGRMDVATLHSNGTVYVALQNEQGAFELLGGRGVHSSGTSTTTFANTIEAVDFNGDGRPDLAFTEAVFNRLIVLLNNGSDFTAVRIDFLQTLPRPDVVRVADFNNDGKQDVAVLSATHPMFAIVQGNGDGTFTILPDRPVTDGANFLHSMAITDLDNDGNKDLLIGRGRNRYEVFTGNGDSTFDPAQSISTSRAVYQIKTADLNDDGLTDILLTYGDLTNSYLTTRVQGAGNTFVTTEYQSVPAGESISPVVADFDLDGTKDVIVGGGGFPFSEAGLFRGTGGGQLAFVRGFPNLGNEAFSAADFNNDGRPDYAAVGAIYLNTALHGPCLSVADAAIEETDSGSTSNMTFNVSLSAQSSETVTVNYRVVGRNAVVGLDLPNATGTITFLPGSVLETLSLPVSGDDLDELDETFTLVLENPVNASIKGHFAVGTINDNDDPASISIGDVTVTEGHTGPASITFPFALSSPSGKVTKVRMTTMDGTATSPGDFTAVDRVFALSPGSVNSNFAIPIVTDTLVEPDESFEVALSSPESVTIGDGSAVGTILNDDIGGNVQFGFSVLRVKEHSSATITVTRLNGNASNIVASYATSNGSAIAGQDYTATSGQVVFGANETSKTFSIPILIDNLDEEDEETILLNITQVTGGATFGSPVSATIAIVDDDPLPVITTNSFSLSEGSGNTTNTSLTVNLSTPSGREVRVNYASQNGTAISPDDFLNVSGTLIFEPGQTTKNIPISIVGDRLFEANETFGISFDSPANATLGTSVATITIMNDDGVTPFDFDGDGKADMGVFRPSGGEWWLLRSGVGNAEFTFRQFGISTDQMAPADWTGDGIADVAVFRETGEWYVLRSGLEWSWFGFHFGGPGDIAVPGDYDGDGMADAAVYRPSERTFYIFQSSNLEVKGHVIGLPTDKPVVGDFDGDGRADPTLWRDSTGEWFILASGNNYELAVVQFGTSGDKTVAADYTGDGITDIAVWRPSEGVWYIIDSGLGGYFGFPFGLATDLPAAADYDGDGKADPTVFRPESGDWYSLRTTEGLTGGNWGTVGDRPVAGAYVR